MMQLSENTPIRTVQHIIEDAKALGLRVVHKPDNLHTSNVIDLMKAAEERRMRMCVSPEAA